MELQGTIIHRWLQSKIESGKGAQAIVPEVETLMQSANQTSFLYTMAILLWRKVRALSLIISRYDTYMFSLGKRLRLSV